MQIRLAVSSILKLPSAGLTPEQREDLLSRYVATPDPSASWGAGGPVQCARECGGDLLLPRGQLLDILTYLNGLGHTVAVDANRASAGGELGLDFQGKLHPYQQPVADALVQGCQGFVVLPCGGGKTVIALGAMCAAGRTTLVLVHTKELLVQWFLALQKFCGAVPGQIRDKFCDIRPVTVAMIQTLAKWPAGDILALGDYFGTVITDEIQHLPALTWFGLQNLLTCRNRWGLSATPSRPDGMHTVTEWVLGPKLAEVTYPELLAGGHLMAPAIYVVPTDFAFQQGGEEEAPEMLARLGREIEHDDGRNQLILRLVLTAQREGRQTLVLVDRIRHAERLARMLAKVGVAAWPLSSRTPHSLRHAVLSKFQARGLFCLVATQLADEGLDLPRLESLVLAAPSRSAGRTQQRAGRLMRTSPGKRTPWLFDLADSQVVLLAERLAERLKVYRGVLQVEPTFLP